MHSHFWYAIIEVKKLFYSCYQRIVGDGKKTRFWEDWWIGHRSLCQSFPRFHNLSYSDNGSRGIQGARAGHNRE